MRRAYDVRAVVACLGTIAIGLLAATGARAQEQWPSKPVRFVVNFAPGGSTDNAARPFADRLSKALNQQFVIENRAGASGAIGVEAVARSQPDGYTFLVTGSPVVTVIPQARKVNWDPFKDLQPVAHITDYMLPICVNPSLPVNSIAELKAYAQANPGKLNCGSAGLGTFTHLICETLKRIAGIDNLHVPYRGGADALNDFLAGTMQIHSEPNVLPHVKAGKAKLLAIADRERHPDFPNVPLISELYPGIAIVGWFGVFAPAGTPQPIIERLHAEINKIAALPEIKSHFLALAQRAVTRSTKQFADLHKADFEYYGKLVRELGIKLD
jgi:tripartite-type tricarboxylate transporter receptor subunit TctC